MATSPLIPPWKIAQGQKMSAAYLLRFAGVKGPPVDVDMIAEKLGVLVWYAEGLPYSGAVQIIDGAAHVWVRASDVRERRRFTLAHELGHLLLHLRPGERDSAFRDESFAGDVKESQANGFAANLLMPMDWIDAYASKPRRGESELARIFEVSEVAMRVRLMKWSGDGRTFDGNY